MLSHLLISRLFELKVVVFLVKMTMKARFKGKAVENVELLPHNDTCGLQLRFLVTEAARVVAEHLRFFREQFRNYSHFEVLIRV